MPVLYIDWPCFFYHTMVFFFKVLQTNGSRTGYSSPTVKETERG